jgi:hypothetical protein
VVGLDFPQGRARLFQAERRIRAERIDTLLRLLLDIRRVGFRLWLAQSELVRAVELHYYEARGALLGLEDPAFAEGGVQDCVIPDGVAHEGDVHTRWQLLIDLA